MRPFLWGLFGFCAATSALCLGVTVWAIVGGVPMGLVAWSAALTVVYALLAAGFLRRSMVGVKEE